MTRLDAGWTAVALPAPDGYRALIVKHRAMRMVGKVACDHQHPTEEQALACAKKLAKKQDRMAL